MLADHRQGAKSGKRTRSPSLLAGNIVDEHGEPLVATHAVKGKVRYRYYVSRTLQHEPTSTTDGMRVPAREIEAAVIDLLQTSLGDVLDLLTKAGVPLESDRLKPVLSTAESIVRKVGNKDRC
jgi:site-specific DNA recombinase